MQNIIESNTFNRNIDCGWKNTIRAFLKTRYIWVRFNNIVCMTSCWAQHHVSNYIAIKIISTCLDKLFNYVIHWCSKRVKVNLKHYKSILFYEFAWIRHDIVSPSLVSILQESYMWHITLHSVEISIVMWIELTRVTVVVYVVH